MSVCWVCTHSILLPPLLGVITQQHWPMTMPLWGFYWQTRSLKFISLKKTDIKGILRYRYWMIKHLHFRCSHEFVHVVGWGERKVKSARCVVALVWAPDTEGMRWVSWLVTVLQCPQSGIQKHYCLK